MRQRANKDSPRHLDEAIHAEQRKLNNFLALIAEGTAPKSVTAQIRELEHRLEALKAERPTNFVAVSEARDIKALRKALHGRLSDLRQLKYGG